MAQSAVEILCKKYPLAEKEIRNTSEKWAKITAEFITKWPKGGTFNVTMCAEMLTLIKNHKPKRTGKKSVEKKQREASTRNVWKGRNGMETAGEDSQDNSAPPNLEKESIIAPLPPPYQKGGGVSSADRDGRHQRRGEAGECQREFTERGM